MCFSIYDGKPPKLVIILLLQKLVFAGNLCNLALLVPSDDVCQRSPAVGYCGMWWKWISTGTFGACCEYICVLPERGEAPTASFLWVAGVREILWRFTRFTTYDSPGRTCVAAERLCCVTVFFTSLNLLYYTYEKYWFDEFLPEIRNCTSMCWSL